MSYDPRTGKEQLDHLVAVISGERFLKMQGLGNEVPFFICPYDVRKSLDMEKTRRQLTKQLQADGINVLEINLYDLCVDLLKAEDDWSWYLENETSMTKQKLLEDMQSILDVENIVIPAIAERIAKEEHNVLFLSGVGEIYPFIRSHIILNNLQSTAKNKPTLMFFPGEYRYSPETGTSLELFGKLHDDRYYRAFDIFHTNV